MAQPLHCVISLHLRSNTTCTHWLNLLIKCLVVRVRCHRKKVHVRYLICWWGYKVVTDHAYWIKGGDRRCVKGNDHCEHDDHSLNVNVLKWIIKLSIHSVIPSLTWQWQHATIYKLITWSIVSHRRRLYTDRSIGSCERHSRKKSRTCEYRVTVRALSRRWHRPAGVYARPILLT